MNSLPNYLSNKSNKEIANKKEKKVYKHLLSGALNWKGDFSDNDSLIDNKSTNKNSIRVTEKMIKKILDDSITMGKINSFILLDLPSYYIMGRIIKK